MRMPGLTFSMKQRLVPVPRISPAAALGSFSAPASSVPVQHPEFSDAKVYEP